MIIVTGSIAYDFIIDFPGKFADHILPEQIHKLNLSFNVNHYAKRRGGTAANLFYTLSLLQTPSTLFSVAGKDFVEYKEAYAKKKMDVSSVVVDKKTYTSTGFAITDKADNQIWGYSYGAAVHAKKLQLKTVAKKGDLVLIGPNGDSTMQFVRQSIALGLSYLFDPSFILTQISDADLLLGIKHAAYIIGNDYEIDLIKSRLPKWQELFKEKTVITTLGEKGATIVHLGKTYTISVAKPKGIVDPTGAGDAWRAGFLAGLQRGFALQICGQMGAVAASYAIEQYGTQEHTFSLKDFQNRYRKNFGSLIEL